MSEGQPGTPAGEPAAAAHEAQPAEAAQEAQPAEAAQEAQPAEAAQEAQPAEAAQAAQPGQMPQATRAAQRKTMRAVHSAVLVFEAIVVGLAIPVAITLNGVSGAVAGATGGVVAVLCLVAAGLLRKPAGYLLGSVLQVVTFALGFVVPLMFVLGLAFGAIWFYCLVLDSRLRRRFTVKPVAPTAPAGETQEPRKR